MIRDLNGKTGREKNSKVPGAFAANETDIRPASGGTALSGRILTCKKGTIGFSSMSRESDCAFLRESPEEEQTSTMKTCMKLTVDSWIEEEFEPQVRQRKASSRRKASTRRPPVWQPQSQVPVPLPVVPPPFAPETEPCSVLD